MPNNVSPFVAQVPSAVFTVTGAVKIETFLVGKHNLILHIFPISMIDGPTEAGLDMTSFVFSVCNLVMYAYLLSRIACL